MPATKNLWWGPPRNFDDRKSERKISWLELFCDLVYAAVIAQLTHQLAAHPSPSTAGLSFLLFCLVFWSWVNGSQYYDLHGNDSIRSRLFIFIQMLGITAVAISINDTFGGHHQSFVIAFSAIQLIITYLWWSVGLYDPSHRVFNIYYTVNYILAFILLIISIFTSYDLALKLWVAALLMDLTPGLIGARTIVGVLKKRGQVFTMSAALVERFGLFTIIVLAEIILGTVAGTEMAKDRQPSAWIAFFLSIMVAFLLWSIYFDMTSELVTKVGYKYMQWFIFLHFPLLASLSLTGACINVILSGIETEISPTVLWMFCVSVSTTLFMVVGIARIMCEDEEDRTYIRPVSKLLVAAGILILLLPVSEYKLNTIVFLSIISLTLFIPVFIGVRSWVKYKYFSRK